METKTFGPDLLTRKEAEKVLRVSFNTLKPLLSVRGGPIEARYLNRRLRICKRSLQQYLDNLSERREG